jgi:hypothetical protein
VSRKNPKAGEGPCPVCKRPVFFRTTTSGKLTYACDGCDTSGFADPNGEGHRKWAASIAKPANTPAPPPPAPNAPAPPAPKPKSSAFDLGQL